MATIVLDLDDQLWSQLVKSAEKQGYTSAEPYAQRLLQEHCSAERTEKDEGLEKRFEQLGYLDFGADI